MSRKNKVLVQDVGIDKIESLLQRYYKQLIAAVGVIIVFTVAVYAGSSIYASSKNRKSDLVAMYQSKAVSPEGITAFQDLSGTVDFLKNYILISSAIAWANEENKDAALKDAIIVGGAYKELAEGLAFDMGASVNPKLYIDKGTMKPLWYYRLVLTSKPEERAANLELFRAKYPDNQLLKMLENWSM